MISRLMVSVALLCAAKLLNASDSATTDEWCRAGAQWDRHFMVMRQQGISLSDALAAEKRQLDLVATEND